MTLANDRVGFDREPAAQGNAGARLAPLVLPLLLGISIVSVAFSVTVGASDASLLSLLKAFAGYGMEATALDRDRIVLLELRLPRVLMGFLVGASLAVSGAVMQGLFRNPLADPGLTGVSSGAGLGAVVAIILGDRLLGTLAPALGSLLLPLAAFFGGLASTWLLYLSLIHI